METTTQTEEKQVDSVLSYGAGVNSAALLLRLVREGRAPDLVLFADTGEEEPVTLAHVEGVVRPFCARHGIAFETVRSPHGRMVDYYTAKGAVPSIMRRDCTDKFKVSPIRARLRALGVKKARMLIGIAWDESHRVRASDVQWLENAFPLVEWKMTRADCEAEIARAGWPSPGKSGCRGCPFAGPRGLRRLMVEDPADFERWRLMDENARILNPKVSLVPGLSLNRLVGHPEEGETTLDLFAGGDCMAGACAP